MILISKSLKPELNLKKARLKKITNLILGIIAVIACIPLIIVLILVSLIVPQKKWEEFWDLFQEF